MSCETYFIEQLRERGCRLTPQREMVLSILHQFEGFVTAEAIHERVRDRFASVDLSTIYRTLDLLAELELVAVIDTGDDQRQYELLGVHGLHHHLYCTRCGATQPLAHEELQPLLDQIEAQHGFTPHVGSLTLPGLCGACRAAAEDHLPLTG